MYHRNTKLYFECTACGKCCHGGPDHYVAVSKSEAERIREHLKLSRSWFRRHYLVHLPQRKLGIRLLPEGPCSLLDAKGQCRVYAVRPAQCRTYPFWPEILTDKASWYAEKKRCEGINSGQAVAVQFIERQLRASVQAEAEVD